MTADGKEGERGGRRHHSAWSCGGSVLNFGSSGQLELSYSLKYNNRYRFVGKGILSVQEPNA